MAYDIHQELTQLASGQLPERDDDMRFLAQSFIRRRLTNANTMEATKAVALRLLLEKIDAEAASGDGVSWTKLMDLLELLGDSAAGDFKQLLAARTSDPKTGQPGLLFGSASPVAETDTARRAVPKTTYKLLDALDSVARSITDRPPQIIDAEPEPPTTE